MEKPISSLVKILNGYNLTFLADTIGNINSEGLKNLNDFVKHQSDISIDILDSNSLLSLSEHEVSVLREFEIANVDILNNFKIEYPISTTDKSSDNSTVHTNTSNEEDISNIQSNDAQRAREVNLEIMRSDQSSFLAKNFIYILALVIVTFSMTYIICVTFFEIPESNIRIVDTVIGVILGTIMTGIMNYFFGRSSSTKK